MRKTIDFLPDGLAFLGMGLLVTGVAMVFGMGQALMVAGGVLLITGVAATWRRSSHRP